MIIICNNSLNEEIINELTELAFTCKNNDGVQSKIYWDILKTTRSIDGNFFCYNNYKNKKLIGYLSFFLFEENTAHISGMVHPLFRRQGVFLHLLQAASAEMDKLGIKKIIFSFPKQNGMARETIKFLSGQFLYDEYQMVRQSNILEEIPPLNNLFIQKAQYQDLKLITEMDTICFNGDYSIIFKRFEETMKDESRQIWLFNLNNQIIGKCHVHFDEIGAYIHNVCILPLHQKLGYGTLFFKLVINQLIQSNYNYLYLDVIAHQASAKHIYQNCRFNIINTNEYWCI